MIEIAAKIFRELTAIKKVSIQWKEGRKYAASTYIERRAPEGQTHYSQSKSTWLDSFCSFGGNLITECSAAAAGNTVGKLWALFFMHSVGAQGGDGAIRKKVRRLVFPTMLSLCASSQYFPGVRNHIYYTRANPAIAVPLLSCRNRTLNATNLETKSFLTAERA